MLSPFSPECMHSLNLHSLPYHQGCVGSYQGPLLHPGSPYEFFGWPPGLLLALNEWWDFRLVAMLFFPDFFAIIVTIVFSTLEHRISHVLLQIKLVLNEHSLDPHSLPTLTILLPRGAGERMAMGVALS